MNSWKPKSPKKNPFEFRQHAPPQHLSDFVTYHLKRFNQNNDKNPI